MRIGLDARTIFSPQRRGIGKSLLRLYQTLAQLRLDWEVVAYHREPGADASLLDHARLRFIEMPGDRFDAWLQWRLPRAAKRDRLDVLHCPANHCPRWMAIPTVVTIHDLIPLDLPQTLTPQQIRRFRRSIARAARMASAITCPSFYTRQRLIDDMNIDADQIHVTPWGSDPAKPVHGAVKVMRRYGVRQPFVLHFGSDELRKYTRRLIDAWAFRLSSSTRRAMLLILGLSGEAQQQFQLQCQHLGITDSVVLHWFCSERDVAALLHSARLLAYPSLSEGFGLPILEAFAAKTPVITSDSTSLPEVGGDAAVTLDPTDTAALSNAMTRLLRDRVQRRDLIQRGEQRLTHFSWDHCAEQFAHAIESVVHDSSSSYAQPVAA